MSGVQLASLEADDLLDVLHYMFEEDMHVSSAEEVQSISKTREIIYKDLYGRDYKYAVTVDNNGSGGSGDGLYTVTTASGEEYYPEDGLFGEEPIVPFDTKNDPSAVTKGYIPPTDVNPDLVKPFGTKIDAPLN